MAVAASLLVGSWSVPRDWPGATVVCLASGPSQTPADIARCAGLRTIAVNTTYQLAPDADVLYACDGSWWESYQGAPEFCGVKVSGTRHGAQWGAQCLSLRDEPGVSDDPSVLHTGRHSGYQAINLAYLLGASRIVLLGYDLMPQGHQHRWHDGHPHNSKPLPYESLLGAYDGLSDALEDRGVYLVNCSRQTAIQAVRRAPLDEVLAC